ncbi:hypothetical protein GCM10009608_55180 [Pseudonocardia alaniniphila]
MSRSWIRRNVVGAAAGTLALVALTLGGVTVGTAAAAPAASTAGAVGVQPAAGAAAHGNDNEFDLFENAQFDGFFANFDSTKVQSLTAFKVQGDPNQDQNDFFSSIANNSQTAMCVYSDINFRGKSLLINPGVAVSNLAAAQLGGGQTFDLNDQISSLAPAIPNPATGGLGCPTS